MSIKNRLAQLEKQQEPATRAQLDPIRYECAIQTLADALADITGRPVIPADVEQSIKELQSWAILTTV